MSRRLAWTVLPAVALAASAGAWTPTAAPVRGDGATVLMLPAATPGDRLIRIATVETANVVEDDRAFPLVDNGSDTPMGDLGLAGAALANGPVTTAVHRPAPGTGRAMVTARSKARLPEPATWLMLIGGMYGIGAVLRRRHRAAEAAFTAKLRSIAAGEDLPDEK